MIDQWDPSDQLLSAAVLHALSALDDESDVHAEMWEIRRRHADGRATCGDHRRYRTCWRALAMRRSLRRRVVLTPEFDEALDRRAALVDGIHGERLRRAVDAVFVPTPEDDSPAAGATRVTQ